MRMGVVLCACAGTGREEDGQRVKFSKTGGKIKARRYWSDEGRERPCIDRLETLMYGEPRFSGVSVICNCGYEESRNAKQLCN